MKSYRDTLPPLDTLVFFESAMRHESFTAAAAELHVSQAAVSKRIRQLEDWLGTALFDRQARRLRPTSAGAQLFDRASLMLDFLDHALSGLRTPPEQIVTIASMTVVGIFWLQPRLRTFALSPDACAFNLVSSDVPRALLDGGYDLILLYGVSEILGWESRCVLGERLVPVAAPGLLGAAESLTTLAALDRKPPLLDYALRGPDWIDWARWARFTGNKTIDGWPRRKCASYIQAVGLALRGEGIALGSRPLLDTEIASGSLRPLAEEYETQSGYHLLRRVGAPLHADADRLWAFLSAPAAPGAD